MMSLKWLIAFIIIQISTLLIQFQVQAADSNVKLSFQTTAETELTGRNRIRKRPRNISWDNESFNEEDAGGRERKQPKFKFDFVEIEEIPFDKMIQSFLDNDTQAIDAIMEKSSELIYSNGIWNTLLQRKSYASIKYVLSKWYTSSTFHRKVFLDSIVNGRTSLVKFLLVTSVANLQKDSVMLINTAIEYKRYKILKLMQRAKFSCIPSIRKNRLKDLHPLHVAADLGDLKAAKIVLKFPSVSIDYVDNEGNTALHLSESVEMASFLIKQGASTNRLNIFDQTPLDVAIQLKRTELIKFYLPSVEGRFIKFLSTHLEVSFHEVSKITVRRNQVLEDSFRLLFNDKAWMFGIAKRQIKFLGESGIDGGGLQREWMSLMFQRFFLSLPVVNEIESDSRVNANAISTGNSNDPEKMFKRSLFERIDADSKLYRISLDFDGPVEVYKFAGVLIGKAFLHKYPIRATLAPSILKVLFGKKLKFADLKEEDLYLYNQLSSLTQPNFDFDSAQYTFFSDDSADPQRVRLVTKDNLIEFLDDAAEFSLYGRYRKQVDMFVSGFKNVIKSDKLSIFLDWKELSEILTGAEEVDLNELKKKVTFLQHYWSSNADMFWKVIEMMTGDELFQFIKFVTGIDGLPFGGVKNLPMDIVVHDSIKAQPTSSTCHFILKIPISYRNEEELYQGFLLAFASDPEFFDCNYSDQINLLSDFEAEAEADLESESESEAEADYDS